MPAPAPRLDPAVDAETTAAARAAGIDEVLARGAFINQRPAILTASQGG